MNREIHYRYIVSYLLLAIILLLAFRYFDIPNLVDKFEFALTLSSLLLAILAIFFTIVSAQKQDIQLSKLIETNTRIGGATDEIRLAAVEIRQFAREAPSQFERLDGKLDNVVDAFGTLSTTNNHIPESLTSKKSDTSHQITPIHIDDDQFYRMFGEFQFGIMRVLYLFERCAAKDKTIPFEDFKQFDIVSAEYAVGALNVLEAVNLLSFKVHKEEVIAIDCSPVVKANLKRCLDKVIAVIDESRSQALKTFQDRVESYVT